MTVRSSRFSDEELLFQAQGGSVRSFGELYLRHLDGIYRYLYYRVAKNSAEAEDLTQEVFLRAWKTISSSQKSPKARKFKALLYWIAHNLAVDRWRTEKELVAFDEEIPGLQDEESEQPEERVLEAEREQELVSAVRDLDPKLQDVFICRLINGMSHAETAHVLGLKEGHVRVLQYRALKQIRLSVQTL